MKTNRTLEAESAERLVYEPVPSPEAQVAIPAPLLAEVLKEFRFLNPNSDLPIIA